VSPYSRGLGGVATGVLTGKTETLTLDAQRRAHLVRAVVNLDVLPFP
jgi:hypothetical protein